MGYLSQLVQLELPPVQQLAVGDVAAGAVVVVAAAVGVAVVAAAGVVVVAAAAAGVAVVVAAAAAADGGGESGKIIIMSSLKADSIFDLVNLLQGYPLKQKPVYAESYTLPIQCP